MRVTLALIELIRQRVGRCNIVTGREAGSQPRRRVSGNLFEPCSPEAWTGSRLDDRFARLNSARAHKSEQKREIRLLDTSPAGEIAVTRKGWVGRTKVVTQMIRRGAFGDVSVFYLENGEIKRQATCGI